MHYTYSSDVTSQTKSGVQHISFLWSYRKVPKFWDARNLCCYLPKIQTKMPHLREFHQKGANGIANSEDPDQTAPLGAI